MSHDSWTKVVFMMYDQILQIGIQPLEQFSCDTNFSQMYLRRIRMSSMTHNNEMSVTFFYDDYNLSK